MKTRILIVDDQPHFSQVLRLLLEKVGEFDVREISRPLEVMDVLRIFQPELVIMDMEMPGKNGAELVHDLIRTGALPASSIVVLSGLIEPHESGIKHTPNGPMRFLSKTAQPSQTIGAIREALTELKIAV